MRINFRELFCGNRQQESPEKLNKAYEVGAERAKTETGVE